MDSETVIVAMMFIFALIMMGVTIVNIFSIQVFTNLRNPANSNDKTIT